MSYRVFARFFCTSLSLFFLSSLIHGQSWNQFQGNAAHTGYVNATVAETGITQIWSVNASAFSAYAFVNGAASDGQSIYVSVQNASGTSSNYQVLSLNPANGSLNWSTTRSPYSGYPFGLSAPSVANGSVYVHQYGNSSGGNLTDYPYMVGMNASTGSVNFATPHPGLSNSGSQPTLVGTSVFTLGGATGGMIGYNGTTGAIQWSTALPQQYGPVVAADSSLAYVYMGYSSSTGPSVGTLYAINQSSGAIQYTIANPSDTGTYPSVSSSVVLADSTTALVVTKPSTVGSNIVNFNLSNQTIRWQSPSFSTYTGPIAAANGLIAVPTGSTLTVLNQTDGTIAWTWNSGDSMNALSGNAIFTNNAIFISSQAKVYEIDLATQQTIWSTAINAANGNCLTLTDGVLYVQGTSAMTAFNVTPTPEPASILLIGIAAMSVVGFLRGRSLRID